MVKILHFADAHIDMANYGRHDPQTGLPMRVMDFLKSLDEIVDTAISEKVDLVIFAGDAYKDRTPPPTFQREWGRRMMRLSKAEIPTLLLVGNHDLSPSLGRAHALESFDTLDVPFIRVLDKPALLKPPDLESLPLQVIALPWVSRSGLMAALGADLVDTSQAYEKLTERLIELVNLWLDEQVDGVLPLVLTAHCSVQGATYGGERTVMLGNDLVLPGSLVKDPRLDYVALGHIHKPQDLNPGSHPPVIYPGSIERVDFGEAQDEKYFIIALVEKGRTQVEWRKLANLRPFFDRSIVLTEEQGITDQLRRVLPPADQIVGAIVRLVIEYPRDWEAAIDEAALREYCAEAFEFHLVKRPQAETRIRLPGDQAIGSLTAVELLDLYWRSNHLDPQACQELNGLAAQVIQEIHGE
jgi:exonuclease SbcD